MNNKPTLNMTCTYTLDNETIDMYVDDNRIGNYALGYLEDKSFIVCYVGRSDIDLKSRLKQHINENNLYKCFKFSYAIDEREAYLKECKNWHDFGGLENLLMNIIHPDKPKNIKNVKCPYCED